MKAVLHTKSIYFTPRILCSKTRSITTFHPNIFKIRYVKYYTYAHSLILPNFGNHPPVEELRQWAALEMGKWLHRHSNFKVVYFKKEELREWRQQTVSKDKEYFELSSPFQNPIHNTESVCLCLSCCILPLQQPHGWAALASTRHTAPEVQHWYWQNMRPVSAGPGQLLLHLVLDTCRVAEVLGEKAA